MLVHTEKSFVKLSKKSDVKKISFAIVVLLVVEVLYLDNNPLSFGFPFQSIQYKPDDFSDRMSPSAEAGWFSKFNVEPILLACDVSVAILLVLLLVRYVPSSILVPVAQGCVLGSVGGGITLGLDGILPEPWFSIAGVLILFMGIPITIYRLSFGHKRQKTAIIILACTTMPACIRAGFVVEGLRDGIIDEMLFNMEQILRFAALSGVLVCLCFVVMVLHKRVLSVIWSKKRVALPSATMDGDVPQILCSSNQTDRRAKIRIAVLYTSLLAVVVYIGWHFTTVRKMREDHFAVLDAIVAEFERLKVPFKDYSIMLHNGNSELLKDGWNVSYCVEALVNGEDTYVADIKKSILVPWIQVKIHKKD